jgi:hypothetical protein
MGRGDGSNVQSSSAPRSLRTPAPLNAGELFLAKDMPAASLSRAQADGHVRRLARGLYTTNTTDTPEEVTRRSIWKIVALLFPGSVIGDRSSVIGGQPSEDGSIYLVGPHAGERGRVVQLPGITLRLRRGEGEAPGDMPLPGGIFLAGTARGLLENARLTRGRGDRLARTITRAELEEWLERLLDQRGEAGLLQLRDEAREIAPALGLEDEFKIVDVLIGAVLGTRDVKAQSPLLRARQQGLAYDEGRVEIFKNLREELANLAPRLRPVPEGSERVRFLPFFDAYFSNFIEGTEFTVEEAREIIFDHIVPSARPADAHDVLGTYALVADANEMRRVPGSFEEYLELLKTRHWRMLEQRPEVSPGEFKKRTNRAGQHVFVEPGRVEGTLAKGFALYQTLDDPFARAVFQAFLVAEVHPFTDGNGRISRIMMNAELIASGEERIVIPPVYRTEYIGSLRALSFNSFADRLPRVLDFAQRYTHAINFADFDQAVSELEATNALTDADYAERESIRLRMPSAADH